MKEVLDVCCGSKMFWFDKVDPRAVFHDQRRFTTILPSGRKVEVNPDVLGDFTNMPFPDASFSHVVFDPPHFRPSKGTTGNLVALYGVLPADWRAVFRKAFAECFRVLKPCGTLIFKWSETDVPLSQVLELTSEQPLYGHRSGKQAKTHWVAFLKGPSDEH